MDDKTLQLIIEALGQIEVILDEPMNNHTTFKIGGPAQLFIIPKSIMELQIILKTLTFYQCPWLIIGNGSNLLVRDKGIVGAVILIEYNLSNVEIKDNLIVADAGILLSKLSKIVYRHSLTGFEFASGIPGTLGGGVFMNAGAYGGELKDCVIWVKTMNVDGQIMQYTNEQSEFSYRHSVFQQKNEIIIQIGIQLMQGQQNQINEKMKELTASRISKQPIEKASAGSTFKRPKGYYAGKLIMDSGLQGHAIGDAQVSPKHCGFVVNNNKATANDITSLIEYIQQQVMEKEGVWLETEIKIVGEK